MKRPGLLVLAVVALAIFLFIIFFEKDQPTTDERKELEKKAFSFEMEDVTGIEYDRPNEPYTLMRQTSEWLITHPVQVPAENGVVETILAAMDNLAKKRTLLDVEEADYGLDPPQSTLVVHTEERKIEIKLGNRIPITTTIAMKVVGEEGILIVPNTLQFALNKPLNEFRRLEVFNFDTMAVSGFSLTRRGEVVEFEKKNGFWYLVKPVSDRAQRRRVDDLLYGIRALKVMEFVDNPDEGKILSMGLERPALEVSMKGEDGVPIVKFSMGRSSPEYRGNQFAVLYEGRTCICNDKLWNTLSEGPGYFVDPKLAAFERWSVNKLSWQSGGPPAVFEKRGENYAWHRGEEKISRQTDVDILLDAVADLEDRGPGSFRRGETPPAATLAIEWEGGGITLSLLEEKVDAKMLPVTVSDRQGIRMLDSTDWKSLKVLIDTLLNAGSESQL